MSESESPAVTADKPAPSNTRIWLASALVGCVSAAAIIGFRALINLVEFGFTGHSGSLVAAARSLSPWDRAATCAIGGLIAGLVLECGLRWAARGPQGAEHIDYMDAAREGGFELNDRTTLVRSASSTASKGSSTMLRIMIARRRRPSHRGWRGVSVQLST